MRPFRTPAQPSALILIALCVAGCASVPPPAGPPTLRDVAVRVQSTAATGAGTLIARGPDLGGFILTAAHLVPEDGRVLVATPSPDGRTRWRTAWTLVVDRDVDLALLWVRTDDRGPRWFLDWGTVDEGLVTMHLRPPERGVVAIAATVVGPGRLRTDDTLTQGMSGAGVFHDRSIVGVLYGLRVSPPPPEGRFVPRDAVETFLGKRFSCLLEGRAPAPRR